MAELSREIRQMGFSWGSYSNEGGCEVADCNTTAMNASRYRDFVDQDAELMLDYWQSDYVMVDSVGTYSGSSSFIVESSMLIKWKACGVRACVVALGCIPFGIPMSFLALILFSFRIIVLYLTKFTFLGKKKIGTKFLCT